MGEAELKDHAEGMYGRTRALWEEHQEDLFGGKCGYAILASPPRYRPDLLIIGENPGFDTEDAKGGAHEQTTWPHDGFLDGETWRLKEKLRRLFADAGHEAMLRDSVVTNFLFFKSRSLSGNDELGWRTRPLALRRKLESFCLKELQQFAAAVEPKVILVLGMGAFDRHAQEKERISINDSQQWHLARGRVFGKKALALRHPTGARWSNKDWGSLRDWLSIHLPSELDRAVQQRPTGLAKA